MITVLKDAGALKFGVFELASGKQSLYYIDTKKAITNPVVLSVITKKIVDIISTLSWDVDAIAGVEIGGVPIATAVSLESGLPLIIVRKKAKGYGTGTFSLGMSKEKRLCWSKMSPLLEAR